MQGANRDDFDRILACRTPADAKRAGRAVLLRPDWDEVRFDVMTWALRGKFASDPRRSWLLGTYPRPLAENSPTDYLWGARDARGGYTGQNLLGIALMRVRDEVRHHPGTGPDPKTSGACGLAAYPSNARRETS